MAMFIRLLGWLRPYRRSVVWSGILAAVAMVMTVAIPWLSGRAIDRVRDGDRPGLTTLGLAILAAGDRKSTRLNSSHRALSRMPSSA